MKVLVAGASSRVGRYVCARLAADGHSVRGMSRTGEGLDTAEAVAADVTRPETLAPAVDGVDAVLSVVGAPVWPIPKLGDTSFEATDRDGNIALFTFARDVGVSRVVYLSVFGDYPPGMDYVEAHRAVEAWLAESGLTWAAVRPTGFFGVFDLFADLAKTGVSVNLAGGEAKTNPIHEADLADVLVDALTEEGVVACGGPDVLSRRAIAELAFRGKTARLIPIPGFVPRLQAGLLGVASKRAGDVMQFLAHVATHDAVAPVRGTRRLEDYFRSR